MMKFFFTRFISAYSLRYPHSIVYMLQASEYKIADYLNWWRRVSDFRNVEQRKKLVKTANAKVFLFIAWLLNISIYTASVFFLFFYGDQKISGFLFGFLLLFFAPVVLAYGILLPFLLIEYFFHKPRLLFLVKKRTEELALHKGVKIGIAGSFGKTTMREILKTVLGQGKKVACPEKNFNTLVGISNFIKGLKGDEDILIFELGEYYKGDIQEMCEFVRPEIGVITGVNEAHLKKFKSLDTTASTIFELADWLTNHIGKTYATEARSMCLQGSPVLYVNEESPLAREYAKKYIFTNNKDVIFSAIAENITPHFIFYEKENIANLKILNSRTDLSGTFFSINYGGKILDFKSGLLGLHQIGALAVAIHLGLSFGIPIEKIQKGISETKPFPHRMEPKHLSSDVLMIDDSYNGNPDGIKAGIEFLSNIKGRRRFYATPGLVEMGERNEMVHLEIGRKLASSTIEKIILIKNSATPFIEKGLKDGGYMGEILWFETVPKMLSAIPHITLSGDVILLQNDWGDQYY